MRMIGIASFSPLVCMAVAASTAAQDVRYYQGDDGITYKESRRKIQRPVTSTEWREQPQTVYRQEVRPQMRDSWRSYYTPVTELRWVSQMHGRWNPFAVPYYTHHLTPVTRWEARSEAVQVPTWRAEWVAATRTARVPITTTKMAEEEIITRVAVSGPPPGTAPRRVATRPATAAGSSTSGVYPSRPAFGGVAMPSDPPRFATGWRSTGDTRYR